MAPRLDNPLAHRCAIAIMAKAPQPGRSKTRLCPPLEAGEAARLSGAFIADMTASVVAAAGLEPIDGWVAYAPAGTEDALREHVAGGTRLLLADGGDVDEPGVSGFGRVLLGAMRGLFAMGYGGVCVLNSDSPTLPAALLAKAARVLLEVPERRAPDRAVLGPVSDGGYYLLGLRHAAATMFADIAWSTDAVAAQTRLRAGAAGIDLVELGAWYDVDDQASLRALVSELSVADGDVAPATAAMLARLGLNERLKELS